ncbi:hypothetical protein ABH926_004456 [Catenulispora sp. GP43]
MFLVELARAGFQPVLVLGHISVRIRYLRYVLGLVFLDAVLSLFSQKERQVLSHYVHLFRRLGVGEPIAYPGHGWTCVPAVPPSPPRKSTSSGSYLDLIKIK